MAIPNLFLVFFKCEKSDQVHNTNNTADKEIWFFLCKTKTKNPLPHLALPTSALQTTCPGRKPQAFVDSAEAGMGAGSCANPALS